MPHTTLKGSKGTILIGEDEPEVRNYLATAVKCHGFDVAVADDGSEVLNFLRSTDSPVSGVLLDIMMPRMNGIEAVREIRKSDPELPIIMVSGITAPETIVEIMKSGATDYLTKPITHDQLCDSLRKALNSAWTAEVVDMSNAGADGPPDLRSVGWTRESESMVRQVGAADVPVLILGETGSGKEVLARRLHAHSSRCHKPFLKLNCAALPSELVESELFGYDRGAFTGAFQKKSGMFELADGGTLLLDEIGDMDLKLQAKLLQVLQDQTFQHLGGKETISVNVRVLAATHRDLENACAENLFREDLYYRLNVISIRVPPLRERQSEVIPLSEYFLTKHASPDGAPRPVIPPHLKRALLDYGWPGNVRELENVMRRFLILRDVEGVIAALHRQSNRASIRQLGSAPQPMRAASVPAGPESVLEQVNEAKEAAETKAILDALNSTHWNRKQAARMLGIEYKALLYRMRKLGIESRNGAPGEEHRGWGIARAAAQAAVLLGLALAQCTSLLDSVSSALDCC